MLSFVRSIVKSEKAVKFLDFRHSPGNGIIPVYLKTRVLTISEFESNMIYNAELKD